MLVGSVCSPFYSKYMHCLQQNINSSNHKIDVQYKQSINFTKIIKKTKVFCRKYKKIKFNPNDCDTSFIHKEVSRSRAFCKRKMTRDVFLKLNRCPLRVRMIWFRYLDSILNIKCKIIDPLFHLIPNYGLELKCYPKVNYERNPLKFYGKFCSKYNYTETFNCIGVQLKPFTSYNLTENKTIYISKAKEFAHSSYIFCQKLKEIDGKMSGNETYCDKVLFNERTEDIVELVKTYSNCVTTNPKLRMLVEHKLISFTWNPSDPAASSRGNVNSYRYIANIFNFLVIVLLTSR